MKITKGVVLYLSTIVNLNDSKESQKIQNVIILSIKGLLFYNLRVGSKLNKTLYVSESKSIFKIPDEY